MSRLDAVFKWVMLISGILTATMFYTAVAPDAAMRSNFGESLDGPLAGIIVRSWGMLVGLVGAMLVYGAFQVAVRRMVLVVAALSKLAFVALILLTGRQYLATGAIVPVVADSVMVVLFAGYLLASPRR